MPLYGRAFGNTDGPGASFSGVTSGSWEPGVFDYKALALSNASIFFDNSSQASWSYDTSQRTMISFDTPEITARKAALIKQRRLGGAMWWEASGDKSGAESLLSAVGISWTQMKMSTDHDSKFVHGIGGNDALEQGNNILDYPTSMYDNIRAGMPQ